MEPIRLIEDGLLLRAWRPGDAERVHHACQDPDIQRWTGVPTPYLMAHAEEFVANRAPRDWAEGTAAPFAVCDERTGELLGSCGLITIDRVLHSAEVGYWTAPWARGRQIATRAIRIVCRWAFQQLGIRRITWQAEIGNHASRLAALRVGFRVDGELRLAQPHPAGSPDGWIGSLLPTDLVPTDLLPTDLVPTDLAGPTAAGSHGVPPAPDAATAPGSLAVRRAAVFGRSQPVLTATTAAGTELRLRPLTAQDSERVITAARDPESIRWTSVPDPYRPSDAEFFIHRYAPSVWARGTGAVFGVVCPEDRYAGVMELRVSPADPLQADVGFVIAPFARGRGYCPAALAAVCTWGFAKLDLARIEWRAYAGNHASRRAAEKAGFRFEGTARRALPHRGDRVDAWVAALLPEDAQR